MSGICRIGPAGAEPAAIPPRKCAFGASGPRETDRRSREQRLPQPKPHKTLQIRGFLASSRRQNAEKNARFRNGLTNEVNLPSVNHFFSLFGRVGIRHINSSRLNGATQSDWQPVLEAGEI